MERNIYNLANNKFDLLIVGGGIHGAVLLWQATLAGLSTALIEKDDFGHATSANSQKIIHGGIRYLQSFDFARTRQSLRERGRLMRLAPHLVHPLPCIMPIYGHGLRGLEAMSLGLRLYDFIGKDRNKDIDSSKFIPNGEILSTPDICKLIPFLNQVGLRGGAKWYDAFCYNTERLVLAFIKSAVRLGGAALNYLKAKNISPQRGSSTIIRAHDKINDEQIDILAKNVINCSGPWIYDLLDVSLSKTKRKKINYALGINVITEKLFPHNMAVGLRNHFDEKTRLYFVAPWRGKSIIGTEWFVNETHPDNLMVEESQCLKLINGLNAAYPPANLTLDDVDHVHVGLVPCKREAANGLKNIDILNHFRIIDHRNEGLKGVVSAVGVKYTTAADVAEKTLRYMYPSIKRAQISSSHQLAGGEIENFLFFKAEMKNKYKNQIMDEKELSQVILNYGSETGKIIALGSTDNSNHTKKERNTCDILKGQTLFAVREEMAHKLSDVVLRRTQLGTTGQPSESKLENVSILMAKELGWNETKRMTEINDVKSFYPSFLSSNKIEIHRDSKQTVNIHNHLQ
jgi:glycerol-3-phosphate dehydrogenase